MNIFWHTWEPGLHGDFMTSGGGAAWTSYLWNAFNKAGHDVHWLEPWAKNKDGGPIWELDFPIDVAVFCWRWRLPNEEKYEERNKVFERQTRLISWCVQHKIPFMVHDQDLKMTEPERDYVRRHGGIIATPSFYPNKGEIMLHYPNPYGLENEIHMFPRNKLVYVGNNYERLGQTIRLITAFSEKVETIFYGNWTESSGGRSFESIKALFPKVIFPGRLPQPDLLKVLRHSRATVLLHKPEYGPRGFMTIRWAEAAAAGTIPFIPVEFALPEQWIPLLEPLRVSGGTEMLEKYARLFDEQKRLDVIENIRKFVAQYMVVEQWLIVLERLKNRDTFYT